MTAFPKVDMFEVTRLTREGRLAEAMALLQGGRTETSTNAGAGEAGDKAAPGVLDMAAPSFPGGAWTLAGDAKAEPIFRPRGEQTARPGPEVRTPRGGLAGFGRGAAQGPGRKPLRRARAPVPDGARFEERTVSNGAGSRTYKVYVPSRFAGEPVPVVVMLHGCTQDPDDFALGTRMNEAAEEHGFLVVYPRQSPSANAQKCWNWFKGEDQRRGDGEPSLIAGAALQTIEEFSADRSRVYVAGLSAGGAAAAVMAAAYPDLFAGVGVHSGLACGAAADLPSAMAAMAGKAAPRARTQGRAIPTIVFHGDADRTVHPVNAEQVAAQTRRARSLTPQVVRGETPAGMAYTQTVEFDDEGRPVLEQWTLHGAGHAWSGGSPAGSYTDPRGPDASREMIRFFLSHEKPAGT